MAIIEWFGRECADCAAVAWEATIEDGDVEALAALRGASDQASIWLFDRELPVYEWSRQPGTTLCMYHATPRDGSEPGEYIEEWTAYWTARRLASAPAPRELVFFDDRRPTLENGMTYPGLPRDWVADGGLAVVTHYLDMEARVYAPSLADLDAWFARNRMWPAQVWPLGGGAALAATLSARVTASFRTSYARELALRLRQ